MKSIKSLSIVLCFIFASFLQSCKNVSKDVAEKVLSESVEKTVKNIVEESSEKALRTITRKELMNLSWEDLLKITKGNNINIYEALSKFDRSFQTKLKKAFAEDYEFFTAIVSSNTVFDEFSLFVKNAPKLSNDINILRYFAKCKDLERRFGVSDALNNVLVKEENGIIRFINKNSGDVVADLRDGIVNIKNPFENTERLLTENSILKKELIPNSAYKIRAANGLFYLYHVDNLGRINKIEANHIDADALLVNVIHVRENLNLGDEWRSYLKKIKQNSKGDDIKATINFKYVDDDILPTFVKTDIIANNKKIVSQSFENLDNISSRTFTSTDNAKTLDAIAAKVRLSTKKRAELLNEMGQDDMLAKLIHSNPELNTRRWLKTRNHVNKSIVAKTANGRMVPNGQVYAGNVYYFTPHLNSGLNARVKNNGSVNLKKFGSLSYDDLIKLDRLYPDGIPFSKEGFPDFINCAFKGKDGKVLRINIGQLSGDSRRDINIAETLFQKLGYAWESGYTWHHIENSTELIRVPTAIHQLVDHAGGMSTYAVKTIKDAA